MLTLLVALEEKSRRDEVLEWNASEESLCSLLSYFFSDHC